METDQNAEIQVSGSSGVTTALNTNAKVLDVSGLPCFDPKGDPFKHFIMISSLGTIWTAHLDLDGERFMYQLV